MENMYDRIRKLRNELHYSQEQLAQKVGYADKTAIAKVEAGKVDLPQSKILLFARALNTTTTYLMDGDESFDKNNNFQKQEREHYIDEKTLKIAKSLTNDPELIELMELLQKVDKGERMIVNQLLQKFVDGKK